MEEREEWSSVGRCDGGEGRVEFSREGDVILKHSIQ